MPGLSRGRSRSSAMRPSEFRFRAGLARRRKCLPRMSPCHGVAASGSGVPPIGHLKSLGMSDGRLLITGVDASGRSCAVRDDAVTLQGDAGLQGILYSVLYAAPSLPAISAGGGRAGDLLDLVVAPGAIRWTAIEYPPGAEFSMHHTDTVDFDVVVSGSVDLILDDGEHPLAAG